MNRRLFFKELFNKTAAISASSGLTSHSISDLQIHVTEVTDKLNSQISDLWDLMETHQQQTEELLDNAKKRIDDALVLVPYRLSQVEFQQYILFIWCLILSAVVGIDLTSALHLLN